MLRLKRLRAHFSGNGIETDATALSGVELDPDTSPLLTESSGLAGDLLPLCRALMIEKICFRPSMIG